MSVEKDIRARLGAEIDALKKDMRTGHSPQTLGEHVAWEREFGAEFDAQFPGRATPRMRVERVGCTYHIRRFLHHDRLPSRPLIRATFRVSEYLHPTPSSRAPIGTDLETVSGCPCTDPGGG